VRIALNVTDGASALVRMDIDYLDAAGRLLARMNGYECVIDPALNDAFRRNTIVPASR
jgi:hypothetical protein